MLNNYFWKIINQHSHNVRVPTIYLLHSICQKGTTRKFLADISITPFFGPSYYIPACLQLRRTACHGRQVK